LRIAPNDVDLLVASATNERSRGRSDAQLALLERAQSLDPRSSSAQANLATTLLWVRRPREALEATDRALSLSPTNLSMFLTKVMVHLAMGDLAGARAVLRSTPPEVEPTRLVAFVASTWDLFWALDDDQQQLLLRLAPGAFDDDRGGWGLALAATSHLRGDDIRARAYGDSAAIALQKLLDATPDDNYLLAMQAVAFAYAGRRDEAIRAGERSVELLPIAKDAYSGAYNQHELARVYAILGDVDKTIDQLEGLLVVPYFLTPAWLRVDPTFAFLKGNPRFERLVTGS